MDKVRVLHLIDHLSSGGAQYMLVQLLTGCDPARFEQSVGYFLWESPYEDLFAEHGIASENFGNRQPYKGLRSLMDPAIYRRFSAHLADTTYDLIVVHLFVAPLFLRLASARGKMARLVYVMHNHVETLNARQLLALRYSLPIFDRVISEFPTSSPQLLDLGVPSPRLRLIPLGVDDRLYSPAFDPDEIAPLRRRFGLPPGKKILLSVARLDPDKYVDLFIQAFSIVQETCPDTVLLVVGHGPEEASLRALASDLGVGEQVFFVGKQPDPKALYGLGDVYLAVSAGPTDIGIAATKAMLCGKPVATVDILEAKPSPGPETVPILARASADPEAFAGQVLSLIRNEKYARNLAERGYKYVKTHHTVSSMVAQYQDLYMELVA